jgi:hypothetical protein
MMNRLSAVWLCAIGTLVACGGQSGSGNGNATGGESTAGSTSGGSSAGQSASGGSTAANSAGSNTGGAGSLGHAGSGSGGTFSVGNGGSSTGGVQDMSDPGSGTCPAFTPCGGSLVGTWHLDSLCMSPPLMYSSSTCPSAQEQIGADGTLTFGADGTLDPTKAMLTLTVVFPPSCITDSTACDQLGTTIGPCTSTADGGCRCTPKTTTSMSSMETYTTSGNMVVLTSTDPNTGTPRTETAYYCVTGNQLRLRGRSTSNIAYVYAMTRQ